MKTPKEKQKRGAIKFHLFEEVHLTFSIFAISFNFFLLYYMDQKGYSMASRLIGYSNILWAFTQFTWWTNILITIWFALKKIVIKFKLSKFKVINLFFNNNSYIYWVSYIAVVGTLFSVGSLYLILSQNVVKTPEGVAMIGVNLPDWIGTLRTLITLFVHFVNPILYVFIFIYLLKNKIIDFNIRKSKKLWLLRRMIFGMIFPCIYFSFYVWFSLTKFDPYPISNMKKWEGIWIMPVVILSFFASLFLFSNLTFHWKKDIKKQTEKQKMIIE